MTDDYRRLRDRVDAFAAEVSERRRDDLSCGPGCSACCEAHLSVSAIEAAEVVRALDALAPERREALRARAGREAEGDPRCVMLDDDGLCAVYEARPIVCRTQGLPLLYPPGFVPAEAVLGPTPKGDVTCCPLNFTRSQPSARDVLDMGHVDTMLALIGRLVGSSGSPDAESADAEARFSLAALAGRGGPFR